MAEGGGLLNRYTLKRRIEGSNPSGSANHLGFLRNLAAFVAGRSLRRKFPGYDFVWAGFWTQN